jgi:DNA-binding NarL/FixJ family response regulator
MDLAMPNGNGLDATRRICANASAPKVLVLSAYQDDDSVRIAFKMGASGYITKHSAACDLLEAVRQVCSGKQYCSPRLAGRMRVAQRHEHGHSTVLTAREHEVLALIAGGLSNKQVGSSLNVSTKTVEKHRQHVMDKLNIHEIAGLTRYALERGIIPISEINGTFAPNS